MQVAHNGARKISDRSALSWPHDGAASGGRLAPRQRCLADASFSFDSSAGTWHQERIRAAKRRGTRNQEWGRTRSEAEQPSESDSSVEHSAALAASSLTTCTHAVPSNQHESYNASTKIRDQKSSACSGQRRVAGKGTMRESAEV